MSWKKSEQNAQHIRLLVYERPPPPPPALDDVAVDDDKLPVSFDIFLNHSGPNFIESLNLIESLILIAINRFCFSLIFIEFFQMLFEFSKKDKNKNYIIRFFQQFSRLKWS